MKILVFLTLLLSIRTAGFTQVEFAPIGAEWYYSQFESFNPPRSNYIKHVCIKDSAILSKRVKVIQKTKFGQNGMINLGFEYLHQSGDTIFYWKGGEFHILYNFSLSRGDSIILYSEMPNYCIEKKPYGTIRVDSVYSIQVNNKILKAYTSSPTEQSKWTFESFPIIETIGSTYYLLPQNSGCIMDVSGVGPLRCYSDHTIGNLYFGKLSCDTIIAFPVGFKNLKSRNLIRLYPNPILSELNIEFNETEDHLFKLDLFDLSGKSVYSQTFCKGDKINLSNIPKGIYQITIYDNYKFRYNASIFKY